MSDKTDGEPAFGHGDPTHGGEPRMSLRTFAAICLCVPNSGEAWLDDLIRRSLRQEFAKAALISFGGKFVGDPSTYVANRIRELADALLAELEKGGG